MVSGLYAKISSKSWRDHRMMREDTEKKIAALTGDPITTTIAANKLWMDHLKRTGIRK